VRASRSRTDDAARLVTDWWRGGGEVVERRWRAVPPYPPATLHQRSTASAGEMPAVRRRPLPLGRAPPNLTWASRSPKKDDRDLRRDALEIPMGVRGARAQQPQPAVHRHLIRCETPNYACLLRNFRLGRVLVSAVCPQRTWDNVQTRRDTASAT
jgi:hypothetical protein